MKKKTAAALGGAAAASLLGAAWGAYRFVFVSPMVCRTDIHHISQGEQYDALRDEMHAMIDDLAAIPCVRVSMTARDGTPLQARYYPAPDGAPFSICFHGFRGHALRDFSGGAAALVRMGHRVLLVDQRGQGESGGRAMTFGVKERLDCLDWINWSLETFGPNVRILLHGISMGATTVLLAAGLELPENVKGIIADCPYTTPKAIIRKCSREISPALRLIHPLLWTGARLFAGIDPGSVSAVEAVRQARVPILLIHGEEDRFVPVQMSREIAAAGPTVELHTFPGAGHGLSYLIDQPRYDALVRDFIARCLA